MSDEFDELDEQEEQEEQEELPDTCETEETSQSEEAAETGEKTEEGQETVGYAMPADYQKYLYYRQHPEFRGSIEYERLRDKYGGCTTCF